MFFLSTNADLRISFSYFQTSCQRTSISLPIKKTTIPGLRTQVIRTIYFHKGNWIFPYRFVSGNILRNLLERFSFECRKVIGFAFTTLRDWFKKLAPLFHPIRNKTKTNRDSLVRVFPHFASATCNYFVF